jgi:hypothetical protein
VTQRLDPVIVRYRARGWPSPWRDHWEERAAIMEFDGGLSRDEAEWEAFKIVEASMKEARMS